jgi:hypothetical protein
MKTRSHRLVSDFNKVSGWPATHNMNAVPEPNAAIYARYNAFPGVNLRFQRVMQLATHGASAKDDRIAANLRLPRRFSQGKATFWARRDFPTSHLSWEWPDRGESDPNSPYSSMAKMFTD